MRRISVGLLKKPVKQSNANSNEGKIIAFDFSPQVEDLVADLKVA